MKRIVPALAALSLVAACGQEPQAEQPVNVALPANAADIVVPAAKPVANAAAPAEVHAGLAVNLAPDELTLVDARGSARHVAFGTDKALALKMLSAALGDPVERATNEDCGAGALDYAAFREGLSLYFQDGKFAGWDLDGRDDPRLSTAAGVGIGTTRKTLEATGPVSIDPSSTLGIEFAQGDLSGLLSARGPEGEVTNLWAGVTCIAR